MHSDKLKNQFWLKKKLVCFQIFKFFFKNVKKIENFKVNSKKSENSFKIKKDWPRNYLCANYFFFLVIC